MNNKHYDETWKNAQAIVGTSPGRPENDFYPTPSYVTEALLYVENFPNPILEPACGDGAISKVLIDHGYTVYSSDLYDYGYGHIGVDFLDYPTWIGHSIITNPPFKLLEKFIEKSIGLRVDKFAFLAKLSALEGFKRSKLLDSTPLKNIWVFRRRITLTRNGEKQRSTGMIAFAWFVWEEDYTGRPMIGWI